ncbi:MAG: hypothetical protein P1U36_00985 [Legionellaceae bacterium]|nr:hypothetical protein [Legionellaceae bacterium]
MTSKRKVVDLRYLTHSVGTAKVMNTPIYVTGERLSTSQMFFKSYKSGDEFQYQAVHILPSMSAFILAWHIPTIAVVLPMIVAGIAGASAALSGIYKLCGDDANGAFYLDTAEDMIKGLCQILINVLVVPLALCIMLTRGISTGLEAAGITGEHHDSEEVRASTSANL